MTIPTQQSSNIFLGNGITNSFNFTFVGDSSTYITVTYTDEDGNSTVLSPSQYTIFLNPAATGALWGIGGTVTYPLAGDPIDDGTSLTIARILPLTQLTSISNQGPFAPQVIESAMDTLEMQIQQVSARNGLFRGIWATDVLYNLNDTVVDGVNGTDTGNYYVCAITNTSGVWATDLAAGDWTLMIDVQSITDDVAAAAASASAAATSATSASSSASSASTSATTATTQATNAATSASNASTSATNAASSASSASTSAATATTQATNAATSATSASSSASSASTSATSAASSATAAAASAAALSGGLSATSTSSVAIATGAKTFTIQASKLFVTGQILIISSDASALNYMHGTITSYSGTTLIMNITDIGGSGTHADWTISVSGTQGSGTVTNVSGTTNRITVATGTTTPVIDISASYVGQASITTLGTIASGSVPFSLVTGTIPVAQGGTGLATLTTNNVILGNGTSNVQFVAPGTLNNVLTSNGTTWISSAAPSAGSLILLSTQTASNSISVVFNATFLTTTYKKYIFDFIDIVMANDGVNINMVVSEDNGSTYKTTNEYNFSALDSISSSASPVSTPGVATANIVISPVSLIGNSVGRGLCGTVIAFNPLGTTLHKRFLIDTNCEDNGGATGNRRSSGTYIGSVNAINNIKFLSNSGNIASGTFKLYGVL